MRITFLHKTANFSGGNKVVAQYADRLARRGHQVHVVTGEPSAPSLAQRLRGFVRGRAPFFTDLRTDSWLDALPHVAHHVVRPGRPFVDSDLPDADVVVATWWETAEWVARLSPRKGAKAYFVQGMESTISGMPAERVEATLDLPLHPIVVARFLEKHLREVHGMPQVSHVPNAVDLARFDAPARTKQAAPTVLCIHTRDRVKGFDVTREALAMAKRALPALRAICFGTTAPDPGTLEDWVEVHVTPPQDAIPGLYARADVLAHGSRIEGFGLPILEAMACRTPVVATPTGAAPELLAEGGGAIVPSEDPAAMARELVRIASASAGEWRELSDRAHRTAHAYSLDDATDRMERALEEARASAVRA
jgi:glycosyltransferase involved in cell wall biosynthesis